MSLKHVVHEIAVPGLPGDGFTAPEALALRNDVNGLLARSIPIPFVMQSPQGIQSTTTINVRVPIATASITVPPGTYKVNATGVIPLKRSVGTGNLWGEIGVNGVYSQGSPGALAGAGIGANQWYTAAVAIADVTITSTGVVNLVIAIYPESTAGTSYIGQSILTGTLTRIG